MAARERTDEFLPLHPRVFMVLLALSEGPAHGYAIKKGVEHRSNRQVVLDAGALYRSIARLVDDRLIEETDEPPGVTSEDARRRYYRLTGLGRSVLAAEATRLASLVDYARRESIIERGESLA